jgi:hypothetical protein
VVKKLLLASVALAAAAMPAKAVTSIGGFTRDSSLAPLLTLELTDHQQKSNYIEPLLVAVNKSNIAFNFVRWSCTFYKDGDPVDEDTFDVNNVPPGSKVVKRSISQIRHPFDTVTCRFVEALISK